MDTLEVETFYQDLAEFYTDYGRHDMLWRRPEPDGSFNPYKILVSELMLQQTQVSRVAPKYVQFLEAFPDARSLAAAPLGQVLQLWSGLGYNRRAKFLWQAAQLVVMDFDADFPRSLLGLQKLPGVGPNTAGAIMAYAYDQPVVFIETNIRTVIIHHFFKDQRGVSDKAIGQILEQILAARANGSLSPREFYWAMMDFGAFLKKSVGNLNRHSKSYSKQSSFHGSRRQLRGQIIRMLAERPHTTDEVIKSLDDERAESVVTDLLAENMIIQFENNLSLS